MKSLMEDEVLKDSYLMERMRRYKYLVNTYSYIYGESYGGGTGVVRRVMEKLWRRYWCELQRGGQKCTLTRDKFT